LLRELREGPEVLYQLGFSGLLPLLRELRGLQAACPESRQYGSCASCAVLTTPLPRQEGANVRSRIMVMSCGVGLSCAGCATARLKENPSHGEFNTYAGGSD